MNIKLYTKEKCTYWHIKGTSFAPDSNSRYKPPTWYYPEVPSRYSQKDRARYQAPSRHSMDEYHGLKGQWTPET